MKSGSLNLLEPSGPVQACNGTALPYTLTMNVLSWMQVVALYTLLCCRFLFTCSFHFCSLYYMGILFLVLYGHFIYQLLIMKDSELVFIGLTLLSYSFGSILYHCIYDCMFCTLLYNFVNYVFFFCFVMYSYFADRRRPLCRYSSRAD